MTVASYIGSKGDTVVIKTADYTRLSNKLKLLRLEETPDQRLMGAIEAELASRPPHNPGGATVTPRSAAPTAGGGGDGRALTPKDNNPPADDEAETYRRLIEEQQADFLGELADHEMASSRVPKEVKDDDDLAKVNAYAVRSAELSRKVDKLHAEMKAPWLLRGRVVDTWKNTLGANLKTRAEAITARATPYLQAKKVAAEAEVKRRRDEAAAAAAAQAETARLAREAAQKAETARLAAEQAIRDAETEEARVAATEAAREAAKVAQVETAAAGQADKDVRKLDRVAVRENRALTGGVIERTTGGGAAARVVTTYDGQLFDRGALLNTLGPLGPFLSDQAITDAIARAAKVEDRPHLPGVAWVATHGAKITGLRT